MNNRKKPIDKERKSRYFFVVRVTQSIEQFIAEVLSHKMRSDARGRKRQRARERANKYSPSNKLGNNCTIAHTHTNDLYMNDAIRTDIEEMQ